MILKNSHFTLISISMENVFVQLFYLYIKNFVVIFISLGYEDFLSLWIRWFPNNGIRWFLEIKYIKQHCDIRQNTSGCWRDQRICDFLIFISLSNRDVVSDASFSWKTFLTMENLWNFQWKCTGKSYKIFSHWPKFNVKYVYKSRHFFIA